MAVAGARHHLAPEARRDRAEDRTQNDSATHDRTHPWGECRSHRPKAAGRTSGGRGRQPWAGVGARSGSHPCAAADAVALLERRDDLASVAALLRPSPDDPLGAALAALDRAAGVRASAWRRLAPLSSPRLEAVAWQSPEAWWAALAGPA